MKKTNLLRTVRLRSNTISHPLQNPHKTKAQPSNHFKISKLSQENSSRILTNPKPKNENLKNTGFLLTSRGSNSTKIISPTKLVFFSYYTGN